MEKKPTPLKNCHDCLKIAAETKITFGWLSTSSFQKMMLKIVIYPFFKAILVRTCTLDFAGIFQNCFFFCIFHKKIKKIKKKWKMLGLSHICNPNKKENCVLQRYRLNRNVIIWHFLSKN